MSHTSYYTPSDPKKGYLSLWATTTAVTGTSTETHGTFITEYKMPYKLTIAGKTGMRVVMNPAVPTNFTVKMNGIVATSKTYTTQMFVDMTTGVNFEFTATIAEGYDNCSSNNGTICFNIETLLLVILFIVIIYGIYTMR